MASLFTSSNNPDTTPGDIAATDDGKKETSSSVVSSSGSKPKTKNIQRKKLIPWMTAFEQNSRLLQSNINSKLMNKLYKIRISVTRGDRSDKNLLFFEIKLLHREGQDVEAFCTGVGSYKNPDGGVWKNKEEMDAKAMSSNVAIHPPNWARPGAPRTGFTFNFYITKEEGLGTTAFVSDACVGCASCGAKY